MKILGQIGKEVHIPDCEEDNSFAATQCTKGESGVCQCVQKDGTIIPGTKHFTNGSIDCEMARSKYRLDWGIRKLKLLFQLPIC